MKCIIYFMPCKQVAQVAYSACGRRSVFDFTTGGQIRYNTRCIHLPSYRSALAPCNKEFPSVQMHVVYGRSFRFVHGKRKFARAPYSPFWLYGVWMYLSGCYIIMAGWTQTTLGWLYRASARRVLGAESERIIDQYMHGRIKYAAIAGLTTLTASGRLLAARLE